MEKVKQRLQYTIRILNSHKQFIEMAYDEDEARRNVAQMMLLQDGFKPGSDGFEEKLMTYMRERLRLVYIR